MAITISGDSPNFTSASVTTLNAPSGVLATQNGMTGIAKAWVQFTGASGGATINQSFNVSSITRNGTGDYTVNFTTAMPNANYAFTVSAEVSLTSGGFAFAPWTSAPTTTALRFLSTGASFTNTDCAYNSLAVFSS
jgi:hypothetical protein